MPLYLLVGPGDPLSRDFKRALKGTCTLSPHRQWIELDTFSWAIISPSDPYIIITVSRSTSDGLSPILMKAAMGSPPWSQDAQAIIDFTNRSGVFQRQRLRGARLKEYERNARGETFSLTYDYTLETSFARFEFPEGS